MKLPLVIAALTLLPATGCRTMQSTAPAATPVIARVFIEALPEEPSVFVVLPVSGVRIAVDPRPVLLEFDLERVQLVDAEFGRALLLQFTPAASRDLFQKTTGANGRRFVLALDDAAVAAFPIEAPVTGGLLTFYPEVPDVKLTLLTRGLQEATAARRAAPARQR